ncbi:60 kDa protein [polyscias crinivirus 1]|nr:60 kDa protein [polyscias crinivirus 1]
MEPIDSSQRVRQLFSCVFKLSDVTEKLRDLNLYLLKNLKTENKNTYRTQVEGESHTFISNYTVSDGRVHVLATDTSQVIKLIIIYFYRVEPELLKKTIYAPENLFARLKFDDYVQEWEKYYDKDLNDYLSDNPTEGCLFSFEDIEQSYPGEDDITRLTLYRICNSLGRLIPIDELKQGKIEAFTIHSKFENEDVGESLTNNALFKQCVVALKDYLFLNSSRAGKEKIRANKEILNCFLQSLTPKNLDVLLGSNPLILSKFIVEFSNRTVNSKGFGDNFKAVKTLAPELLKFMREVFLIDAEMNENLLYVSLPKNSVVEILGDKFAVSEYLRVQNVLPPSSNSSSLPPDVDTAVTNAIVSFFKRFGNFDSTLIQDIFLFVLGKMTTNLKRWQGDNELSFVIGDIKIETKTNHLLSFVETQLQGRFPNYPLNNFLRRWANLRGDRAKNLFQLLGFRPNLFSNCPGIVPYMRFDFYKMINLSKCTRDEIESYQTLRRMTESRSNGTISDESKLYAWILRK